MKDLNDMTARLRGIQTQDDARAHVFEAFNKKYRKGAAPMPDRHKEQLNWLFDLIWDLALQVEHRNEPEVL